jgi:hypothetical protein
MHSEVRECARQLGVSMLILWGLSGNHSEETCSSVFAVNHPVLKEAKGFAITQDP